MRNEAFSLLMSTNVLTKDFKKQPLEFFDKVTQHSKKEKCCRSLSKVQIDKLERKLFTSSWVLYQTTI